VLPRDTPVIDAALLYVGGTKVREDLSIPVLTLLSETELATPPVNEIPSLQPDTGKIRVWETAGTSHSDWLLSLSVMHCLGGFCRRYRCSIRAIYPAAAASWIAT
jgi:hypothetical protein